MLYGIAHRWIEILNHAQTSILHLGGQPFAMPELMPISPIAGFEDAFQAARVMVPVLRASMDI